MLPNKRKMRCCTRSRNYFVDRTEILQQHQVRPWVLSTRWFILLYKVHEMHQFIAVCSQFKCSNTSWWVMLCSSSYPDGSLWDSWLCYPSLFPMWFFLIDFCFGRKLKLLELRVRRSSIWICFTRISTVPPQQERTLQSCHFCPWWPVSNYQEHLTIGAKAPSFINHQRFGAEKPLCHYNQPIDLWGGIKVGIPNIEKHTYTDTMIQWCCSHINVVCQLQDYMNTEFRVFFRVGHVFYGFSAQPNYNSQDVPLASACKSCIIQTMKYQQYSTIWVKFPKNNKVVLLCYNIDMG